jgi:hypothetical protein
MTEAADARRRGPMPWELPAGHPLPGHHLVRVDAAGTLVFTVSAVVAALVLGGVRYVAVGVALVLLSVGIVAFLWSYALAVQRSRWDEIGVAAMYFLTGGVAPRPVAVRMNLLLAVQVVVGLATASVRPFTTLAFGTLVPVFGLGLNGLWAARHGHFGPRVVGAEAANQAATQAATGVATEVVTDAAPQAAVPTATPAAVHDAPPVAETSRSAPAPAARQNAGMAETATQSTTIHASPARCLGVVLDFERYPEWAKDVKEAVIVNRDEQGRAMEVEFRASALGRSTHYTLAYDYSGAPERVSWRLVKGDIMQAIDGTYSFTPSISDPDGTDVVYVLSIELVVPLPGFVKRRAEVRILNTVKELKARAEA